MLVLSRKVGESIVIDGSITVSILDVRGDVIRLGIVAPRDVTVHRSEVSDAIQTSVGPSASEPGPDAPPDPARGS